MSEIEIDLRESSSQNSKCGYCQDLLSDLDLWTCEHCETQLHVHCHKESQSCVILGCIGNKGPGKTISNSEQAPRYRGASHSVLLRAFFQKFALGLVAFPVYFVTLVIAIYSLLELLNSLRGSEYDSPHSGRIFFQQVLLMLICGSISFMARVGVKSCFKALKEIVNEWKHPEVPK